MSMSLGSRIGSERMGRVLIVKASIGIVAALVVAAALFLLLHSRNHVEPIAKAAREAIAAGRFDEARALLDRWSALAPRDGEAEYRRAWLEVNAERPAEALDAIRRARDLGYALEPLLILRAVIQARAGRFDEAEPVLRRAFTASAEPRVVVAEGLARIYLKTFRFAECAPVLESWMKIAPDDARPYLWRAEIDDRVNTDPPVLIRNYREALHRDPTLAGTRQALADKLREAALVDEAEVEYAKILEANPKSVKGHAGAGQIALLKGDLQGAIRHFEEALAHDPNQTVALRELGLIDLKYGRVTRACERLKKAIELEPEDTALRYSYANALGMAGDKAQAAIETAAIEQLRKDQKEIARLREDLAQHPHDLELRSNVAKWLIEHNHDKEGLEWTRLILVEHPGHPPTCKLLADYYTRKGNAGLANYYRTVAGTAGDSSR